MANLDDAQLEDWRTSRYPARQLAARLYEDYVKDKPPRTRLPDSDDLAAEYGTAGSTPRAAKRLLGEHGALGKRERTWVVA